MTTRALVALPVLVLACADPGSNVDSAATSGATTVTTAATTGTTGTTDATTSTTAASTSSAATTEPPTTGNPTSGTATSSTSSTTDAVTASTSSDSTGGLKLDVGVTPDFGGDTDGGACPVDCKADMVGQVEGDWLLHSSENGDLVLVDVADGSTTFLCTLDGPGNFLSITFTRDNRLVGSNGGSLAEVDPCTCVVTKIGSYSAGHGMIYGIAPDEGNNLFGISAQADALVRIDAQTGETTEVGPLGGMWGTHGAAWSEAEQILYAVNGSTDDLYTVDIMTGMATVVGDTTVKFGHVGVEEHPATGLLYGCTAGILYQLDKVTGVGTMIAPIEGISDCTNLGAPWTSTQVCLPIPG